jgi:hypothetical protein
MKLKNTRLRILQEPKNLCKEVKTGVSLHCHTKFSKEMLDFIPHYAEKLPIISFFWQREKVKYQKTLGKPLTFDTAYWSPPFSENEVYSMEKNQIEQLGLAPIISISDHDNIEANLSLNQNTSNEIAPISLEWTVPYQYGFFHVGVHNLPTDSALEITQKLLDYTFSQEKPNNQHLHELFAMLNEIPEVLVILNHPLWDIELVGKEKHKILLKNFITEHGQWIHAFEVNGFRSWSENKAVIELAESINMPICTGGDRHGCKPNTVLNLTNAKTFSEFVDEVRNDKRTEVVIMPEYSAPLHSRQMQSFSEILSYYDHFPAHRKRWFDRVYFDYKDQGLKPLSDYGWVNGGPVWLRLAIKTLGFFGNPKLRPIYRMLMKPEDVVPKSVENKEIIENTQSVLTDNDKLITDN